MRRTGGFDFWGAELAVTDEKGRFRVEDLTPGSYLWARASGHGSSLPVCVTAARRAAASLRLELAAAGTVTGVVRDPRGVAVAGAVVAVAAQQLAGGEQTREGYTTRARFPQLVRTDERGGFVLDEVPPGPQRVWAIAPHLPDTAPCGVDVAVVPGLDHSVPIDLSFGAVLRGQVTEGDGRPAADQRILVGPRGYVPSLGYSGFTYCEARTARDGTYVVRGIPPGRRRAAIDDSRGQRVETEIEFAPGREHLWSPSLESALTARVRVLHVTTGEPLEGWWVRAGIAGHINGTHGYTDASGLAVLEGVEHQANEVAVGPRGQPRELPAAVVSMVSPAENGETVVRVTPGTASVALRALAPDGSPAAAQVWLRSARHGFACEQSTSVDGRCTYRDLAAGDYRLSVAPLLFPAVDLGTRTLRPGEALDLGDVRLSPGGRVAVRAFVPDGVARDQLEVEINRDDTRRSLARGENDDVWRSPPLRAGLYRIALQGPGVLRVTSEVVVQPDREVYVDLQASAAQPVAFGFRLAPGAPARWFRGRLLVRDRAGSVVGDARLAGELADSGWLRAVLGCPAGSCTAQVLDERGEIRGEGELEVTNETERVTLVVR